MIDPHRIAQIEAYTRMAEQTGKNPDFLELEIRKRKICMFVSGLKKYSILKDIRLLDIGCFNGSLLNLFRDYFSDSKINCRFVGVDLVYACCKETNSKGFESIQVSADTGLPFEDKVFSLVFSSEVLEHCLDTFNFLSEIRRVLRDDGFVFLTTPNINSIRNRWRILLGKYPYALDITCSKYSPGHVRVFNFSTLEHLLEKCGFKVLERSTLNLLPIRFSTKKGLKSIDGLLCSHLYSLGSKIVILAQKK